VTDILAPRTRALLKQPAVQAAIDVLLDAPGHPPIPVTLPDGTTVTVTRH
jgi:hypothetical protein